MARALRLAALVWFAFPTAAYGARGGRQGARTGMALDTDAELKGDEVRLNSSMFAEVGLTVTVLSNYAIMSQNNLKTCWDSQKPTPAPYECTDNEGSDSHACWAVTRAAAMAWSCNIQKPCLKAAKLYSNKHCHGGGYYTDKMPDRMHEKFPTASDDFLKGDAVDFHARAVEHINKDKAIVLSMGTSKEEDVKDRCPNPNGNVLHFVTIVGYEPHIQGKDARLVIFDPWMNNPTEIGTYRTQADKMSVTKSGGKGVAHPNIKLATVAVRDGRIHISGLNFAGGAACVLEALVVSSSNKDCPTLKETTTTTTSP